MYCINKEQLIKAQEERLSYVNYILCENNRDIMVGNYINKDICYFYVSLYSDNTHLILIDSYNRLDAENAYEVIEMFLQQNKSNPNYFEL